MKEQVAFGEVLELEFLAQMMAIHDLPGSAELLLQLSDLVTGQGRQAAAAGHALFAG